ncbi:transcriptional regulator [Mycolicibacterium aromaticivorans JS19b1 = JCM 16368]|uniref:Transcriptional regulator n=1 Tax=Mycolicibacterium aromaticivorans JS19b1 = JCM 16368 TaxID=1440774 RepID=A0A064CJU7_9MYCO|nr:LCP family protein [Mycolicibacterium aromaticivorans]KDF00825.1 transcriptional regulator [Mycolicibacterium aromaticivorans JS19b1 = JCM 16368]
MGRAFGAFAAVAVLGVTGLGWSGVNHALGGIITSDALIGGPTSASGAQNILIMGLDSRLDQHGQPLPKDVYDALHAGDETVGGYNANVLIVVHIPADGSPTAVSIPRDDYVDLAGCPTGMCQGKIKQAYGLAYQHALNAIDADFSLSNSLDPQSKEQRGREAGRKAEIATVQELLGVPIDHFVEVTLGAFYEIAKAVAPITVCLNGNTSDDFSGADFRQGVQQLDAAQAMAFVRQRRDVNNADFTDMDRTRRQQAFIVSLISALRRSGDLDNPLTLNKLLDTTKQNLAVDADLDLAAFAQRASAMTKRPPSMYTLPITGFGQDPAGEDVNLIDVSVIRSIVHDLFASGDAAQPTSSTAAPADDPMYGTGATLDVANASSYDGLAAQLEKLFTANGFDTGRASTAAALSNTSAVGYGDGVARAGKALAAQLNLPAAENDALPATTVQLTVGTDFPASEYVGDTAPAAPAAAAVSTVSATATGTASPAPTDLSHMTGESVPCVK